MHKNTFAMLHSLAAQSTPKEKLMSDLRDDTQAWLINPTNEIEKKIHFTCSLLMSKLTMEQMGENFMQHTQHFEEINRAREFFKPGQQ